MVKNYFVKKTVHDKLVVKANNIDTSDFVLKTMHSTGKTELENKIPDASNLVKKTKLTELKNKIPDISNLATKTALTTVENKIPSVSNLATKTALTTLENKIPDVTNLATKTTLTTVENKIPDVSSLVKKTDYNTRAAAIDTKISTLDGEITKSKDKLEETIMGAVLCCLGSSMFNGEEFFT